MPELTVRVAADVPENVAGLLAQRAAANERSLAAEIRLALRAWVGYEEAAENGQVAA